MDHKDYETKLEMQAWTLKLAIKIFGYDPLTPPIRDRFNEEDQLKYALIDLISQDPDQLNQIIVSNPMPIEAEGADGEDFETVMRPVWQKMRREAIEASSKLHNRVVDQLDRLRGTGAIPEYYYKNPNDNKLLN